MYQHHIYQHNEDKAGNAYCHEGYYVPTGRGYSQCGLCDTLPVCRLHNCYKTKTADSEADSAHSEADSAHSVADSAHSVADSYHSVADSAHSEAAPAHSQADSAYSQADSAYSEETAERLGRTCCGCIAMHIRRQLT